MHISVRELYPIVLPLELWADQLANKRILFHFDKVKYMMRRKNVSLAVPLNMQNLKALSAIVTHLVLLSFDQLANKRILFHFDNISVVYCINKQTYKNADSMRLVVQALTFHIYFEAEHVPGITNILADKLSRFQIEDFKQLATGMDPVPIEI
jgi:hypothetical protein